MPEKSPTSYELLTYAWVLGLSVVGGVVSFYNKWRRGHVRAFNIVELIGEVVTSGFIGVLTFWLCEAAAISPLVTAAAVGVAGHMGSRAVFALEKQLAKRMGVEL